MIATMQPRLHSISDKLHTRLGKSDKQKQSFRGVSYVHVKKVLLEISKNS